MKVVFQDACDIYNLGLAIPKQVCPQQTCVSNPRGGSRSDVQYKDLEHSDDMIIFSDQPQY